MRLLPIAKARGIRRNVFDETCKGYTCTRARQSGQVEGRTAEIRADIRKVCGDDWHNNGNAQKLRVRASYAAEKNL